MENDFVITKKPKFGGTTFKYKSYNDLEQDYVKGVIHPGDLKPVISTIINELLEPVRQHFQTDTSAKKLLSIIRKYKITK